MRPFDKLRVNGNETLRRFRPALGQFPARLRARAAIGIPARQPRFQILTPPAKAAFLQQQRQPGRVARRAMLRAEQHARRRRRIERQLGELFAPWRDAAPRIQRAQPFELALRRGERGRGRRVEPGERGRIARAPLRQFEQQRGQIGGFHFRRIEARSPAMAAFLPQAIGDARPLTRGAARALCRGGLAGAMRDQMRRPRRAIEFGAARQAGIDHHRHAIQSERGFGDRARQHDPPPPVRIAPDRQPLLGRLDLAVER